MEIAGLIDGVRLAGGYLTLPLFHRLVLLVLLFPAAQLLAAEELGVPLVRVFTRDDYRQSPVNWQAAVHPNGLVYVTNNFGVLEYDGVTWRRTNLPRKLGPSMLAIDGRGRVWTSVETALSRLSPDGSGGTRREDLTELLPEADRAFGKIIQGFDRPEGFYALAERHLFLFREDGTTRTWKPTTQFDALWTMAGAVHVLDRGRGLLRVEKGELVTVAAFNPPEGYAPTQRVSAVFAERDGVLLTNLGPLRWDGRDLRPLAPESAALFRQDAARAGIFLRDGRLALATLKQGLLLLDRAGGIQVRMQKHEQLPNLRINGLAEDLEGGIWLALQNGIARVQAGLPFATVTGGYRGSVRAVIRHADKLYVGHADGVTIHDPATGNATPATDVPAETNGAICFATSGGRLLVSLSGLREILPDGRLVPIAPTPLNSLLESRVHPGLLVGGTPGSGLWLFAPRGANWQPLGRMLGVPASLVRMIDTGDGFIWGTAANGVVWRADFRAGVRLDAPVQLFGPEQGAPATVGRGNFTQIFSLGSTVAIAARGFVARFDPIAQRFTAEHGIRDFPPGFGFETVQVAADGSVWGQTPPEAEGTGERLFHLTRDAAGEWRAARFATGVLESLVINSLYCEPAGSALWLATQSGAFAIDTAWQAPAVTPPLQTLVRSLRAEDGTVWHGDGAIATAPAPLTLAAEKNAVRFDYAAPAHNTDARNRTATRYRTRLDGLDADWSPWTADTSRSFTNLPGRAFAFQVQARDLLGRESASAKFAFAVLPPWWLTPWAWLGYAALGGVGVAGIVRYRTRVLRRHNDRLEKLIAARTEDLRRQNGELSRLHKLELDEKITARLAAEKSRLEVLRYQLNPHFLFNSLAAIRGQIPMSYAAARSTVDRLADFCRLTLHGGQPDECCPLAEEAAMLRSYLDIEQTRLGEGLRVAFDLDPSVENLLVPRLLLLPLVENALKYGLATSAETLALQIAVRPEADRLVLRVSNTGEWVDRGTRPGLPSLGIGHENLRERLERHFPGTHAFTHRAEPGWVHVELSLPLSALRHAGAPGSPLS
ncbi:MAG: hypothetical protein C0518_04935 [Opitutus sp.]|nr:hypothetical protein [Opitutus sp.]